MSLQDIWGRMCDRGPLPEPCLSLELIRTDNECEILLQSAERGMILQALRRRFQTPRNMLLWNYWLGVMRGGGELRGQLTSLSKRKSSPCSANLEEEWRSCCSSVLAGVALACSLSSFSCWGLLCRRLNHLQWCVASINHSSSTWYCKQNPEGNN